MNRRVLLLAGLLVLSLLTVSGPASAEPSQPPIGQPLYLALGDSLAVGVGASTPAVTGYVPQFYQLFRQQLACQPAGQPSCRSLALRNLSVGGATSTTLLATQLPEAVAELQGRNGDPTPTTTSKWSPSTSAATTSSGWCRPVPLARPPSAPP